MNLNAACLIIEHFEGCVLHAYPDPGTHGVPWTIGFGTTTIDGKPVQRGMVCTEAQALQWLSEDVQKCAEHILEFTKPTLNDNQLSALISLSYNIGISGLKNSTLMKKLNLGVSMISVASEFLKWTHAGHRILPGLVARRKEERILFLTAPLEQKAA